MYIVIIATCLVCLFICLLACLFVCLFIYLVSYFIYYKIVHEIQNTNWTACADFHNVVAQRHIFETI